MSLHLPEPALPGIQLGLGAMGLTLSAGLAGWVEFLLLRRALQSRIGPTALPTSFPLSLWSCALIAALGAWVSARYVPLHQPLPSLVEVLAVFGVIYGGLTLGLKIPEARRLLGRFH
jgi:putative peptidoglycan lipid II flippase